MKLLDVLSGASFEAEINLLELGDFELIAHSGRFDFDWSEEESNLVYKITERFENEILGLVSLINIPEEFRIHINLIENAKDNKGNNKKIDWIAGCLIAFAAKLAFEKGYNGFISLLPKTILIDLYCSKYGFSQFGRMLGQDGKEAYLLVQKYLST